MDTAKLIIALEGAAEGSEYLDFAIQRRFGLQKPVPAYTRSLDAAMRLIPEGWSIHLMQRRNDCRGAFTGWVVELYRASDVVLEFPSNGAASSAALALCAAAMRVRHALEDSEAAAAGEVAVHAAALRAATGGAFFRPV
jgi:hypothetical protein